MRAIKKRMQLNNALVGFGLVFSLGAATAADPQVTVTFNGEVTPTNCVISSGATTLVNLPSISVDDLKKYPYPPPMGANTSGKYPVDPITLTGCPASIIATFGGGADGKANSIKNDGTADGVTFSLKNNNNDSWLGASNGMRLTVTNNGNGNFTISGLTADYMRTTEAPPTAGTVVAVGLITVRPN